MEEKKVVYEDEYVVVETTGRNYDFIATIQNKTNTTLNCFIGKDEERSHLLKANDWIGILANDEGYWELNLIEENGISYEQLQFLNYYSSNYKPLGAYMSLVVTFKGG